MASNGSNEPEGNYLQPSALMYPPIFTIGIIVNLIVFCTFYSAGKLSKIVVLVCNMAVADFCMLLTGSYLQYYQVLSLGNETLCQVMNAADIAFLHVSAFTIVVIAFERFIRLNYPHFIVHENSYYPEVLVCGIIWILAAAAAMPVVYHGGFDGENCNNSMAENFSRVYFSVIFFTSYIVPGVVVGLLYTSIIVKTCSSANAQVLQPINQHRITQMLAAIIALFWLFHMPFWYCLIKTMWFREPSEHFTYAVVLTYLNATTNPFMYFMLRTYHCRDFIKCFYIRIRFICPCKKAASGSRKDNNDNDADDDDDDFQYACDNTQKTPFDARKLSHQNRTPIKFYDLNGKKSSLEKNVGILTQDQQMRLHIISEQAEI